METKLIKVGNSKGVIIPSKILQLVNLEEKIMISVEDDKIILAPVVEQARKGWSEIIAAEVEKKGQPAQLLPHALDEEQNEEWTW